jgi:hypothetical protein
MDWMCSTQISSQTEKVREFIMHFRIEIEESVAIRTFLLAASDNRVADRFADGPAHLHNLIGKALLQRQLMLLMRLYDHESRDRACLMALFNLLSIPEVRRAVTVQGSEPTIEAAGELWEGLRDDPRKDSLRKIRDRVSAHNIIEARSNLDQVSYDELWSFSRDTERLVEYLALGSGIVLVRLAAVEEIWSRWTEEYWRQVSC